MNQAKPIIWGIAIVALGLIFGGNALGLFDLNVFFDGWWTLFIIVPSIIGLITEKEKLTSLTFLIAGVLLLLAAQDVFSYEIAWKAILAVVLIMIGLAIIIKTIFHSNNAKEVEQKVQESKDSRKMDSQTAIFSGSERAYNNEIFQGSNLTAIFGGVDLDLRNAKFTKDTVIKAFALFGGVDIIIPEDVQVKIKSGFIFGGITDDRKNTNAKGKHTIYLDAAGGFGGVTISEAKKH